MTTNPEVELEKWRNASHEGSTNRDGHKWTGEVEREGFHLFFLYEDESGRQYESKEQPAIRIHMDNAAFRNGAIVPLSALNI